MRISDWSSDVCSSDLASSLLGALLLPLVIDAGPLLWVHLFLWGGVLFAIYTVTLGLLGDSFAPAQLATANTALIMFYNIGSASGPIIAGRSEEHTSELQSLMRISYAVFCLKKQQHHTDKQYQHI